MGDITAGFNRTYRDFVVPELPASGANEPKKSEIRALGLPIEAGIAAAALSGTDLNAAMQLVAPLLTSAQASQAAAEGALVTVNRALDAIPVSVANQLGGAVAAVVAGATASRDAAQSFAAEASLSAATALVVSNLKPSVEDGISDTVDGGYFAVAGQDDTVATIFRRQGDIAMEINAIPSVSGVIKQADLASYITDMRAVLRRGMPAQRLAPAGRYKQTANGTFQRCYRATTDGSNFSAHQPTGTNDYPYFWVRDLSMAAVLAPEFFTVEELRAFFVWYLGKCTLTPGATRVPDHVGYDGTVYPKPGNSPTWGSREPTDGEPMMVQIAWAHYLKTGRTTLYDSYGATLRAFLDNLPYDPVTKCVQSVAGAEHVTWGFMDEVKLNGSVAMGSVLTFIAYRQLADMAFAAEDYANALYCVRRAEEIKDGINAYLWVGAYAADAGEGGLFKASTGTLSPGVQDVWASALAVFSGAAREDYARAISLNLAVNTHLYFARGGVRHAFTIHDFQPGVQLWQGPGMGGYMSQYGKYQQGGYWPTPLPWVLFAVGQVRQDVAAIMARSVLAEVADQDRISQLAGVYLTLAEWVDPNGNGANPAGDRMHGVFDYMTSAAALLGSPAIANALNGAATFLYADTPQTIEGGGHRPLYFDEVSLNQIGAFINLEGGTGTGNATQIQVLFDGRVQVDAHMYFAASDTPPGAIELRANIVRGGSVIPAIMRQGTITHTGSWELGGSTTLSVMQGDRISLSAFIQTTRTNEIPASAPAAASTFFHVTTLTDG